MDDFDVFERLVDENYGLIYKYCLVKLGGDDAAASDATHETMMILRAKLGELDLSANVAGWLVKTAQNCILKQREREAKYASRVMFPDDADVFDRIPDDAPDVDELVADDAESAALVERIERALDPGETELFRRRYLDEMNPTEISAALDMPYTTTRMRLKRLEAKLRRILTEGEEKPPEKRRRGRPKKKKAPPG